MAAPRYGQVPQDDLDFQDIPHTSSSTVAPPTPAPAAPFDDESDSTTLKEEQTPAAQEKKKLSILTFEYYQQFFDVESMDVMNRMLGSIIPNPRRNYLEHVIRPNPDIYGPFWICATLTFTAAIAGNLSHYLSVIGKDFKFHYDFHKVTFAATAIFGYWLVVPLLIWGLLRWRGNIAGYTFVEIICVYGYSLAIFVPISILWVIPYSALQWTLVAIGSTLSGSVLLITFWPAVKNDDRRICIALMVVIMVLHAALATGFVLYFFNYEYPGAAQPTPTSGNATTAAAADQHLLGVLSSTAAEALTSRAGGPTSL